MTGSVRFHRVLKAPPERVNRTFTTAAAMAKWISPYLCPKGVTRSFQSLLGSPLRKRGVRGDLICVVEYNQSLVSG
jgi:hypothetical protein